MKHTRKILLSVILMIALFLSGLFLYHHRIRKEIYEKNSDHLLATYEQVNRTFVLFCDRNWNVLSDWDANLQYLADSSNVHSAWKDLAERKNNWKYSDFYMFNENCDFITSEGRRGTADSIMNVFQKMYACQKPVISNYTASSGVRKVVFAIPLSAPFTLDGVTFTGVAVSYDTSMVETIISRNIYGTMSSSYLMDANGDIILSLEAQSEFLSEQDNLFTNLNANAVFTRSTAEAVHQDLQNLTVGHAEIKCQNHSYYLVYQPVGLNDWSILGIIQTSAVNSNDEKILYITIAMITTLAICLLLLLIGMVTANTKLKLRHQELLHQTLKNQRDQIDRLFHGMTQLIDRYAVGDLVNNRYEYREYSSPEALYPESGSYQDLIDEAAKKYFVLSDTENIKLNHLLNREYLQKVLRKGNGILKIEYSGRTGNIYKLLNVIAVEWDESGIPQKIMMIAQDLGQRHELENLANTDGLTGLFNERYFSTILHRKEQKKLPFILYYLDLDHFKPVNDTYGHDMGDKLLKEVAKRLQECIRSNDYAFRIGGDEFALIISADMEDPLCKQTKDRILTPLLEPYEIDGKTITIGASCGYAAYPLESEDTGTIRILADQRMYEEKEINHQNLRFRP